MESVEEQDSAHEPQSQIHVVENKFAEYMADLEEGEDEEKPMTIIHSMDPTKILNTGMNFSYRLNPKKPISSPCVKKVVDKVLLDILSSYQRTSFTRQKLVTTISDNETKDWKINQFKIVVMTFLTDSKSNNFIVATRTLSEELYDRYISKDFTIGGLHGCVNVYWFYSN